MLVACRLAGLSALEARYAGVVVVTQSSLLSMVASRMAMVHRNYPPTPAEALGVKPIAASARGAS